MPSNHTSNYNLNQWVKTDKVLMDDFNADNKKIDAALTGKADASALELLKQTITSHTTALDGKGNCKIHTQSYTGTGTVGTANRNKLTFPGKPVVVFIAEHGGYATTMIAFHGQTTVRSNNSNSTLNYVTWDGNTMTWYADSSTPGQLNMQGFEYSVVALIEL